MKEREGGREDGERDNRFVRLQAAPLVIAARRQLGESDDVVARFLVTSTVSRV